MDFSGFETYDPDAYQKKVDLSTFGAHREMFQEHPQGHSILRGNNTDVSDTTSHAVRQISSILTSSFGETAEVVESQAQHKYGNLANASYNWFNSKGDPFKVQTSGFKVDETLSTKDNVVLHNLETGETHISYRGTTDNPTGRTGQFFKDWKINGEIAGGSTHSHRVIEAETQIESVIEKYGRDNLTLSGHSQGGHVSYEMGVRNNLNGYHFNPAINKTQVEEAGKYIGNTAEQQIYKTPLDFASPLAYHDNLTKSNTKLNIVGNLKGKDGVVDTHSIDQFIPTPKEVLGDAVKVERQSIAKSILKGGGAIAGTGMAAYSLGTDIAADMKGDGDAFEKAADVGIDTTKNAEEFIVDSEIVGAGLALAPETFGLSVPIAFAGAALNDLVAEHVAASVKSEVPKIEKWVKKAFSWF